MDQCIFDCVNQKQIDSLQGLETEIRPPMSIDTIYLILGHLQLISIIEYSFIIENKIFFNSSLFRSSILEYTIVLLHLWSISIQLEDLMGDVYNYRIVILKIAI